MTPTRPGRLAVVVLVLAALAYLLADAAYGALPVLPLYAPVTLVLLAVTEAGMARVVRDRLHRRAPLGALPRRRPLHPMQVARAAVLAKASSVTGAVLLGGYAGILAWTLPRRDALATADRDALVAGISVVGALGLVVAALLLERACRTPEDPDVGSRA